MLFVLVTAANLDDREGLRRIFERWFVKGLCRLRKLWVDAGYVGEALWHWVRALKRTHKIDLEVVGRQGKGFQAAAARSCPSAGWSSVPSAGWSVIGD